MEIPNNLDDQINEGVGRIPTQKSREPCKTDETISNAEEGAGSQKKPESRSGSIKQRKTYHEAKFNIGQTTRRKLDSETIA